LQGFVKTGPKSFADLIDTADAEFFKSLKYKPTEYMSRKNFLLMPAETSRRG
jgi:hypothetical protein